MAKGERIPGDPRGREIQIEFEGERLPAIEGEPIAVSLLAAGVDVFSRAVKYHRARGPYCLSGRCSHCVMRVDGEPNVFTCLTPAREGVRVQRQNAFPGVDHDVFRTIDWMYPRGLDHHTMFAGIPVVEKVVAKVAREMAGLGQLPDAATRDGASYLELQTDVVVIGGGSAGIAAARAAAQAGATVTLVDEQGEPGGRLRTGLYGEDALSDVRRWAKSFAGAGASEGHGTSAASSAEGSPSSSPEPSAQPSVHLLPRTFAFGIYREEGLLVAAKAPGRRLLVIRPKAVVLATGATEIFSPFPNNDLPGVFAGRALARLITSNRLLPGRQVVLAGDGPERGALARILRSHGATIVAEVGLRPGPDGHLVRARGRTSVAGVVIRDTAGAEQKLRCDLLGITDSTSAFLDLARHAGARIGWGADGRFAVEVDEAFFTGVPQVFACGEVTGACTPGESLEQGSIAGARAAAAALAAATVQGSQP